MSDTSSYESKDLSALSDLEAIRLRPGMYIGSTEDPRQLVLECTDNSIDEELAGYSSKLIFKYDSTKNLYSTRDYGRGIPIGKTTYKDSVSGELHEIEALQLLFMKNHSGGKFGNNSAYKFSRGIHGIGNKCICALSSYAKAITHRDGKAVELIMSRGDLVDLKYYDTTEPNGMYVEFIPDDKIFETIRTPVNVITELCSIPTAFGMHIDLEIDGESIPSKYSDMYDLLILDEDENINELLRAQFKVDKEDQQVASIVVAMKYMSDTNYSHKSYTNMLFNSGGGSHVRFFENCYKAAWEKYLDDDFRIQDVFIGLKVVIGVSISNDLLAFSSQTKERLTTPTWRFDGLKEDLVSQIREYFDSHEDERNGLIKRFKEYRQSQNKLLANKELSSLIYINDSSNTNIRRTSIIDKLRDCSSKSRKGTIQFLVEGDSAGSGFIMCRDVKHHAILPLRGKVLNVSKRGADLVECMKNTEIRSIINSAGTGIGEDCDASRSRYEQYRICCDSDPDGLNIASLITSIYVNLLPDIVKAGMLYVVQPPLYGWTDKTGQHYTNNIRDVTNFNTLHRYKGLGEFDPEELQEVCINNPVNMVQVQYPEDINLFNEVLISSQVKYNALDERGLIIFT